MKTMKSFFLVVIFGQLMNHTSLAQEEKSYLITVTKLHWNMEVENLADLEKNFKQKLRIVQSYLE